MFKVTALVGVVTALLLTGCDNQTSEQDVTAQQEQVDVELCLASVYAQSRFPDKATHIGAPAITTVSSSREIRGRVELAGADGSHVPYIYVCTVAGGVVVSTVVVPS